MNSHTIKLLILFCACLIFSDCSFIGETRRVLVIHSYETKYAGYPTFNKLIHKQFRKEGINADIRTLYLDCEGYAEQDEIIRMNSMLDSVSKGWMPEVILVNEDQATYSLLKSGHPLSKKIPIVFGGVNYPNKILIAQHSNVTGFHDRIDFVANVGVAKDLMGEKTNLFSILDFTYLDRQIRQDIREQIKGKKIIQNRDTTSRTPEEQRWIQEKDYTAFIITGAREQKSDGGLMWLLRRDNLFQCYIQLKRDFTTVGIGNICYNVSVTAINEAFGFGERLLGGYFTTLPIQVEEEVQAATRILKGTHPSDIPITDSRKEYAIDWKVMQQWGIPLDKVSSKYNVINIPIWEKHPVIWLGVISISILLTVILIIWLFLLYRREEKRKKNALHALADEKQTLALAIEGSNTYVWKFENDLFVFEKAFWESQGMPSNTFSFDEMLNYIHPDYRLTTQEKWSKGKNWEQISQMRCDFNGQGYAWWEFRYTTVELDTGQYRTTGLLLNIQSVKDREQELEEARKLAEKAELKQSFLLNMSHEIRTPLNAIVGFSNILVSDDEIDSEDKQLFIETINRNNELLLKLINDILEISRIESGSMTFEFKDCLLSKLIDDVYMTHKVLIPNHLNFIKETDFTHALIHVDSERLTQVLTNFLNNACKFTSNGSIKLGYQYLSDKEEVCIYVEDTGIGIPSEELKMIFSRFYKHDEFTQGTGLGLSICQVIVEKLGGRIELYSELGKGSRFMVILPCKIIDE